MDGGLETTSTHSKDGTNDDRVVSNGNSGENDDDDSNLTYHSSDGLDEDDAGRRRGWHVTSNVYMWQRWLEFHWGTVGQPARLAA